MSFNVLCSQENKKKIQIYVWHFMIDAFYDFLGHTVSKKS